MKKLILTLTILWFAIPKDYADALDPYDRQVYKVTPPSTYTISGTDQVLSTWTYCGWIKLGVSTSTTYTTFYPTGSVHFGGDLSYDGTLTLGAGSVDGANIVNNGITSTQLADNITVDTMTTTSLQGLSASSGDVFYYDGTELIALSSGTSGQYLKTGTIPSWDTVEGCSPDIVFSYPGTIYLSTNTYGGISPFVAKSALNMNDYTLAEGDEINWGFVNVDAADPAGYITLKCSEGGVYDATVSSGTTDEFGIYISTRAGGTSTPWAIGVTTFTVPSGAGGVSTHTVTFN